ncbi:SPFH domain-containing protein, partial [Streptomyces sp. NPDC006283]
PIELAAVVVWKVEDTAQAMFEVDDFLEFVSTSCGAEVRAVRPQLGLNVFDLSLCGHVDKTLK